MELMMTLVSKLVVRLMKMSIIMLIMMKMWMKCWWWWCSQQRHALQLWGEHVAPLLEKLSLRLGDNSTSTASKHSTSTFCNRKVTIQLKNSWWNQIYEPAIFWPRPPQSSDNAIFDSAIMKNTLFISFLAFSLPSHLFHQKVFGFHTL